MRKPNRMYTFELHDQTLYQNNTIHREKLYFDLGYAINPTYDLQKKY